MDFLNKQLQPLRSWLDSLAARERRMVVWGSVGVAVLIFLILVVLPLYSAVGKTGQRVEQKQEDLAWMRSVAGELRAAGPAAVAAAAASGQSLVVLVDQSAQQTGLGRSLTGSQPSGTGGLRVRVEGAAFDTLIAWLAMLEQQHRITVETATIDRTAIPGVVNASVSLRKSG